MTLFTVDLPLQRRELVFAISFRDRFLPGPDDPPIRVPVELEALGQRPFAARDGSYRFSVTGSPPVVPSGVFPIKVHVPGGEYAAFDAIDVNLPRSASVPPQRADYLLVAPLWPTRRFPIPHGETAVIGVIRKQGVPQPNLMVLIHETAAPLPTTPDARTDNAGEFVYRLPHTPGAASANLLALKVTVLDGSIQLPASPASIQLQTGRVHTLSFNLP